MHAVYVYWCGMIEWMHSDGLGRLATASERIRLVIVNFKLTLEVEM